MVRLHAVAATGSACGTATSRALRKLLVVRVGFFSLSMPKRPTGPEAVTGGYTGAVTYIGLRRGRYGPGSVADSPRAARDDASPGGADEATRRNGR